jgi:hypothetical protein
MIIAVNNAMQVQDVTIPTPDNPGFIISAGPLLIVARRQ